MNNKSKTNTVQEKKDEKIEIKKNYHSPHFHIFGNLNSLTNSKGGGKPDGAQRPKTQVA
jgi:hypothetical protein